MIDAIYPPIGSYALIGDGRSAALIGRDGSLDWLCLPRFDSPSIFGALLDRQVGGYFRIGPTAGSQTVRRYSPNTNILETTFSTAGGTCVLRDLMPVLSEEQKRTTLFADHQVLRQIEGLVGEVEIEILYAPRPNYGRLRPILVQRGALGIWCEAAGAALILNSELPLELSADRHDARGVVRIRAGERRYVSFSYSREAPTVVPALGEVADRQIVRSTAWWRQWAGCCTYQGPYRDAVVRSALALKLMSYAPSGAIVAAPTTSLPEFVGGARNWDYRYCWLRDAAFTMRALLALDYDEEAEAFLSWLLHATRLTWPELQVLYDVFGGTNLPERELTHLDGYAHTRPVRIGNDAREQFQLDLYGEVLDAATVFARRRGRFSRETARVLTGLGRTVCRRWREPDEGIWEVRSGRHHHTHSKVLCWAALDRLVSMHEEGYLTLSDATLADFRRERASIRALVERRGFNVRLQSYTQRFEGDDVDGSLLTLPLVGYTAATDPRMRGTTARIRERLGRGSLIYRYETGSYDGLPPGEGAFGVCSFWAVECLARGGELETAKLAFMELLSYSNDVGLFPEEIDPQTSAALGNFPQAFTHVGLINAALTLAECEAAAQGMKENGAAG